MMADNSEVGTMNRSIEEMKHGVGIDMAQSRDKGKALEYTERVLLKGSIRVTVRDL